MARPADPQQEAERHARPSLRATYRLQLYRGMDLRGARALVPYLRGLGVSHLYLSPILRARASSDHGYDGVDFTRIDARLGTEADLIELADALHAHAMGLVLDFVPNHMAADADNAAWMDVLANGRDSAYAAWFDVDWDAGGGRVVLPVLGERLPAAIRSGDLRLEQEDRRPVVRYHGHRFPVREGSVQDGEQDVRAVLERQHYRLLFWKRAGAEINYRRFFTIGDLIALRQEDPQVFEATHATVLDWARRGIIDGLRIDHVDGLLDPTTYLRRLRGSAPGITLHVEKILAPGEPLPADWPVDGTTGYDFLAEAEDLFVDPDGWRVLERDWRRRTRRDIGGHDVARRAKRRILTGHLLADLQRVVQRIADAAKAAGRADTSVDAMQRAVTETIAALAVYRTYIRPGTREATPHERSLLGNALEAAGRAGANQDALALLRAILLEPDAWPAGARAARAAAVARYQQLCVPAAAKGVEDTAFYAWVPLASRSDVGADPALPPDGALARFHAAAAARAEHHPAALLAVSTHDTKRSADVRARLDVLSEEAVAWTTAVRRWRRWNHGARTRLHGRLVPDAATELLYYQTLVGAWPRADLDTGDRPPDDAFVERIDAYLLKAAREAKLNTSWLRPDAEFEAAVHAFVRATLRAGAGGSRFLEGVRGFANLIAQPGLRNSLARTVLHLASPGVPDIYQGDETWTFDLVDPDNRRPVDFTARPAMLEAACTADKLHVIRSVLALRARWPELFSRGSYAAIAAHGAAADHIVAFAREHGGRFVLAVVAARTRALAGPSAAPLGSTWGDTGVPVPDGRGMLRCALTDRTIAAEDAGETRVVRARTLFEVLPVALLYGERG